MYMYIYLYKCVNLFNAKFMMSRPSYFLFSLGKNKRQYDGSKEEEKLAPFTD